MREEKGIIQLRKGKAKMDERNGGMMRGGIRGDSDEHAITMMDRAEETSARDGGSRRLNRDERSEGGWRTIRAEGGGQISEGEKRGD